ncbi:MAG: NUDIX hydrolase [Pseudomonadota bacterium]|nr:NUDIX hydrolase [Pseudomonadota bacterium]
MPKSVGLFFALAAALAVSAGGASAAQTPDAVSPDAVLGEAQKREILDRTQSIRLAPEISHLSAGERTAVARLIEVGRIFQDIYEDQRHRAALAARVRLAQGSPDATLYRLFQGPIATTLDNKRVPFVAVDDAPAGKNVYPWDLSAEEYEAFLAANPARRGELTHLRSVVRRAESASLSSDLAVLQRYPALDRLHPGLSERLRSLSSRPNRKQLYAVPYSVAYADEMTRAHGLLDQAADAVEADDWEFAKFLRNRARDLLSDDYESGDAAWITGRFKNLNAQIGAYETYDDELAGTRAFYSLNVLARRNEETEALRKGLQGLQTVEDALPYDRRKKIREDIPVGVYDVVADFGQSRGGNTATILPNEAYLARRYGRTILLRANIMRSPEIFSAGSDVWKAVVAPQFGPHLTADSSFHRTLWHEIGHYLGVDRTRDGRDLDVALATDANLLEEMKADLVSLFAGPQLRKQGYFSEEQLRSHYASGINRTLQNNRPRRDQPYQSMQLMQFNWFLDRGVLRFDPASATLSIDYARYHPAVEALLREVLALQDAGDPKRSDAFVKRWTAWDDKLHGRIAQKMRDRQRYRYRIFTYAALGE